MKKLSTLILALLCSATFLQAQVIVYDITTGQGAPGTNDPQWIADNKVAKIANPHPHYATNSCGKWVTTALSPGTLWPHHNIAIYQHTFKTTFDVQLDGCENYTAILDIPFIAADNWVLSLKVNGNAVTLTPYTIGMNPGGSLNQVITSFIVDGTNEVLVTVDNTSNSYMGLQLCGDITLTKNCNPCFFEAPVNLSCTPSGTGPFWFDWNPVTGAQGYELEIYYNDPRCCNPVTGTPFTMTHLISGGTGFQLTPLQSCYSWRVRSICDNNGAYGPWSYIMCNCTHILQNPKLAVESQEEEASGVSVFPNPSNGIFSLELPQEQNVEYEVVSITGKSVIAPTRENGTRFNLDLSAQPAGIYFLKMSVAGEPQVLKLLKQ